MEIGVLILFTLAGVAVGASGMRPALRRVSALLLLTLLQLAYMLYVVYTMAPPSFR